MKLLFADPSPYSRKVRVLARELGLSGRIEEIAVHTTPLAPAPEVAAAHPLSKIPILLLDDGSSLYDSRVICAYLEHLAAGDGPGVAHDMGRAHWESQRRQALADGILDAALLHRYETVLRPKELHWAPWLDAQLQKVNAGLAGLAANAPGCGNTLAVDAIATACALAWLDFRMPEIAWRREHPPLAHFLDEVSTRASMESTRP